MRNSGSNVAGRLRVKDCPVFVVKISGDVRSMLSSIRRSATVHGTGIGGPGDRPCRCAYRKLNPGILVVQPTEHGTADNASSRVGGARYGRILVQ